ncbi:MAG TPA: CaiB/BaiF CoA-transferase family protein [Ramlibacter sp.]|uniref:CaiB/BaiF CoA transferase family protein n=1 Tax=Ramlibacter sp. TaxID=1917967 RepID=UPI002B916D8E|nr:CaiB/BaiF CoA-transferase family protein [Ramlibacter sp.]HVZ45768.1 CaiB/BaiF CoA-transferase family protein [Ramlibacter sp.]
MGPLGGVKVIEFTGLAPGPFAAMMLADMGAQVLRIDRPQQRFRPLAPRFTLLDRNRRAIAVDIKTPKGVALVRRLAKEADALIEGFRPGIMEKAGLGPDALLELNPRLVYGRMTGWGQDGPLARVAGHDINYIALTGALDAVGEAGRAPTIPLNLVGDLGGGGMYLAFGMACALFQTGRSGRGQVVDAAMVDGAASLMTMFHGFLAAGRWAGRGGGMGGGNPAYRVYETSDGKYISIGAVEEPFYAELLRLTGLDDGSMPDRADRGNWPRIHERFASVFKAKTRDEWDSLLGHTDTCFAPVLDLDEAPDHPHNRHRGTYVEIDGIVQPAPAPRFSRTVPEVPKAGVEPGVDLDAALAGWGFSADEIADLRSSGTAA